MSTQQPDEKEDNVNEPDGPIVAHVVHHGRVEWMDTDAAGHHHHTSITRFVEAAEATMMRERGVSGYFGASPRVRYEVEFSSRLWFGQEVTTTLVLERIGTSSFTFRFEVWGEQHEERPRALAAHGRFVAVYVPRGGDRSGPWPEDWRRRLSSPS